MIFTVVFRGNWGAPIYEGIRVESDSALQAAVYAAKKSKYREICSVTEEPGMLEYADDKVIPSCYHCSSIPTVVLYEISNVKFTTLEIPITDKNKNKRDEYEEEDLIMAVRNLLLRKIGDIIPPNHVMVGDSHVEVIIDDNYNGYDDCIEPYHTMRFK